MRRRFALALCVATALASSGAADDVLVIPVKNGDRIVGTTHRGDTSDVFEFECPKGARLHLENQVDPARRMAAVFVEGPRDDSLTHRSGYRYAAAAHIFEARCASSSVYSMSAVPQPMNITQHGLPSDYDVRISWTSRTYFHARKFALDADGAGTFPFSADAGVLVRCTVVAPHAETPPMLTGVSGPRGFDATLGGRTSSFVAPFTGDYAVRFAMTDGAGAAVGVRVNVTPPRQAGRLLSTAPDIDPLRYDRVAIAGPDGRIVSVRDGVVAGAELIVAPAPLVYFRQAMIGDARPIAPDQSGRLHPAGPAVALRGDFTNGALAAAQLAAPFDPTVETPRVFARTRDGVVREIAKFRVDGSLVRLGVSPGDIDFQVFAPTPAPDPAPLAVGGGADRTGAAVAARGGIVAVGAPGDDTSGVDAGAVRVVAGGGAAVTLIPPALQPGDGFGRSLSLSRDGATLAVGTDAGREVFVYSRTGSAWTLDARIPAPVPVDAGFGHAVAVDGDTLFVGAEALVPPGSPDTYKWGTVFVYERDAAGWSLRQNLDDIQYVEAEGGFGTSVAIDGDRAIVGAPRAAYWRWGQNGPHDFISGGAVTLLHRVNGTWIWESEIHLDEDGAEHDGETKRFGQSVALEGRTMLVGCASVTETPPTGTATTRTAAYVIEADDWDGGYRWFHRWTRLDPPAGAEAGFGSVVALSGSNAIVGGSRSAVVFAHEPGNWWTPRRTVTPTGADVLPGVAVAVDGTTLVVGAPSADAAFFVDLSPLK